VSTFELEEGMISLGLPISDHFGQTRLALVISQFSRLDTADTFVKAILEPASEAAKDISETYADYLRHNA
jgi:IclR family pca regulon transcriptional regulator